MSDPVVGSALILGAGLAGGHIAAAFAGDGFNVAVVDREHRRAYLEALGDVADCRCLDVRGAAALLPLLAERSWDVVVWSLRPSDEIADLKELATVVSAAGASGVGRFVYLSSLAVYGRSEDGISEDTPLRPTSTYGQRKVQEEEVVLGASDQLATLVLRLTGLFGPMPDPATGSRSAKAIARVVGAAIAGENPVLRVEPDADQYLYGGDLGGILKAIVTPTQPRFPDVVNVGPGYGMLPEAARAQLEEALGVAIQLEVVPAQDEPVGVLDIAKLRRLVPIDECMAGFQHGVHATRNIMAMEVRT